MNTIIMFSVRNMLELGKSQSWTKALEMISSDTRMNAGPLLDYFQTLYDWLKAENQKYNRTVGWKTTLDPCEYKRYLHLQIITTKIKLFLQEYVDILGNMLICSLTKQECICTAILCLWGWIEDMSMDGFIIDL